MCLPSPLIFFFYKRSLLEKYAWLQDSSNHDANIVHLQGDTDGISKKIKEETKYSLVTVQIQVRVNGNISPLDSTGVVRGECVHPILTPIRWSSHPAHYKWRLLSTRHPKSFHIWKGILYEHKAIFCRVTQH